MAFLTHPSGLIAELDVHELADLLRDLEGEAPALAVSEAAPPAQGQEKERESSNR